MFSPIRRTIFLQALQYLPISIQVQGKSCEAPSRDVATFSYFTAEKLLFYITIPGFESQKINAFRQSKI